METTPSSSAPRTTKVRTTKPAVPKSSTPAKPSTAAKVVAKAVVEKPKSKPKVAAAPRKRKAVMAEPAPSAVAADLTPMIATAAYYLAEYRQFAPGYEMQDWLAAEHMIRGSMTGK
jgi:Protein of unknown function (DUF2934)